MAILGELAAGIFLMPQFLGVVPFASDGTCDTVIFPNDDTCETSSRGSYDDNPKDGRRRLAAGERRGVLQIFLKTQFGPPLPTSECQYRTASEIFFSNNPVRTSQPYV